MSGPTIADNEHMRTRLEQGKGYYFRVCGRSSRQPFCAGLHKMFSDEQVGKS